MNGWVSFVHVKLVKLSSIHGIGSKMGDKKNDDKLVVPSNVLFRQLFVI